MVGFRKAPSSSAHPLHGQEPRAEPQGCRRAGTPTCRLPPPAQPNPLGKERRGGERFSHVSSHFSSVTRRWKHPWCKQLWAQEFLPLPIPVSFHRLMFPVPRRDIHHWFNAIGTFTTNGLIRDASTFFILGAPVGWSRFYLFTGGCGDDGNVEPVRAEKGKVVKYPYLFSKCSVLSLETLLVQVCEEQSVLRVSNVLPCGTTPDPLGLCVQDLTQLCVQSKINYKK